MNLKADYECWNVFNKYSKVHLKKKKGDAIFYQKTLHESHCQCNDHTVYKLTQWCFTIIWITPWKSVRSHNNTSYTMILCLVTSRLYNKFLSNTKWFDRSWSPIFKWINWFKSICDKRNIQFHKQKILYVYFLKKYIFYLTLVHRNNEMITSLINQVFVNNVWGLKTFSIIQLFTCLEFNLHIYYNSYGLLKKMRGFFLNSFSSLILTDISCNTF